jgi:hypothetical protein
MNAERNGHLRNGHAHVNRIKPHARATSNRPSEPSATASSETPSPPAEGRDAGGKFTAGNRFGKGNPHARRMAALRQAFLSVATEARMKQLAEKLYAAAVNGDWQAARLFMLFVLGRPAEAVNPDTLDREEWNQCQEWPQQSSMFGFFDKLDFGDALRALQAMEARLAPVPLTVDGAHAGAPAPAEAR